MSHCCGEIPLEFVSFKATAFFPMAVEKKREMKNDENLRKFMTLSCALSLDLRVLEHGGF